MNNFTKLELIAIEHAISNEIAEYCPHELETSLLLLKIRSMIDNYDWSSLDTKGIAESHLREAYSLISHAMCLLEMKEIEKI